MLEVLHLRRCKVVARADHFLAKLLGQLLVHLTLERHHAHAVSYINGFPADSTSASSTEPTHSEDFNRKYKQLPLFEDET